MKAEERYFLDTKQKVLNFQLTCATKMLREVLLAEGKIITDGNIDLHVF